MNTFNATVIPQERSNRAKETEMAYIAYPFAVGLVAFIGMLPLV